MIHGSLVDTNAGCVINKVRKTSNFLERMLGLLGTGSLGNDEGLLITPCSSVHTFGMRYTIDVLFLDKEMTIVKIVNALGPWRIAVCKASDMVLELAAHSAKQLQLQTGQKLEWHDAPAN